MNTTLKTLGALLLGAALVTPALAKSGSNTANRDASSPGTSANSDVRGTGKDSDTSAAVTNNAGIPAMPSGTAQTADNNSAPMAAPTTPVDSTANGSTRMAMNTTGNAADLSSVQDTSKTYSRSSRARDDKKEAQVTRELNQKESGMNGASAQ